MKNINEKIKKYRTDKKITQQEMAEMLGMTQPNYAKFESGKGEITISRLEKLSEIFEVSVGELLGLENTTELKVIKENNNNNRVEELEKEIEFLNKNIEIEKKIIDMYIFKEQKYLDLIKNLEDAVENSQKMIENLQTIVNFWENVVEKIKEEAKNITYKVSPDAKNIQKIENTQENE